MGDNLKAAVTIETALKHHIKLAFDGEAIRLRKTEGHEQANNDDVELVRNILKANKPELLALFADQDGIRSELQVLQQALIEAQTQFFRGMERWATLDNAYDAVWPLESCVISGDGCPDNAIVRCSYCARQGISKMVEE
jgi:hypothetical protein